MGEAKRRGTFEQRKAEALAEGREKRSWTAEDRRRLQREFYRRLMLSYPALPVERLGLHHDRP